MDIWLKCKLRERKKSSRSSVVHLLGLINFRIQVHSEYFINLELRSTNYIFVLQCVCVCVCVCVGALGWVLRGSGVVFGSVGLGLGVSPGSGLGGGRLFGAPSRGRVCSRAYLSSPES